MIAAAAALVLLAVFAQHVAAQQPDTRDRTIMTISNAVELPGLRLEAGKYVFRIADTASRNVIQVLSEDEMQMLGQWLFVPAERQEVTSDTVVTFRETSADTTPAVQFWFYPGEKTGKEFIYPKDQAMRIAQRTGATVLTEEGPVNGGAQASVAVEKTDSSAPAADSAQQSAAAEVTSTPAETQVTERQGIGVVEGSGVPESTRADAREVRPATAPAQSEAPVGTSGRADAQTSDNVRQESTTAQSELPRTASPLALSGLLGLLSLAGAFGVRFFRG
jgi:hypothetical protein